MEEEEVEVKVVESILLLSHLSLHIISRNNILQIPINTKIGLVDWYLEG